MNPTNQVAQTIADQIGTRAFVMMGAKNILVAAPNTIQFKIRGSKTVTNIQVALDPSDTYTVTFFKIRGMRIQLVATVGDVYADCLRAVISNHTGLYTSL